MVIAYLRQLSVPRLILWCYLIWWLGVAIPHFEPTPRLWLNSLGIAGIIGTGLFLSTAYASPQYTPLRPWAIARLYMMPFFVSSFAALIKGKGFVLVFHPSLQGNARPAAACLGLALLVFALRSPLRAADARSNHGKSATDIVPLK